MSRLPTIVLLSVAFILVFVAPVAATAAGPGAADGPLTAVSPGGLAFGTTYQGTISQPNERDSYTVTLQANDVFYIRMNSAWSAWPQIWIYNPDTTLLDQEFGGGGRTDLTVRAPTTGTYTVLVGDSEGDNVGEYTICVQRLNAPGLSTLIQPGQTVVSAIAQHSEFDTYTYQASVGDHFLMRMNSNWSAWPEIRVYHPNGTLLGKEFGGGGHTELAVLTPATGTYTVLAGDSEGDNVGEYAFYIQRLNNPGNATPVLPGQTLTSAIAQHAELDTYTFQASGDDQFLVRMNSNWSAWPEIRVYHPNGTLLGKEFGGGGRTELTVLTPATGTYTVLAGDSEGDDVGEYSLYVQRLNNPGGAQRLESGQTIAGSIGGGSELDTYTVTPQGDTNVLLTMASSWSAWPQIRVYQPNGTLLGKEFGGGGHTELTVHAPATGTYTVLVGDSEGDDVGTYNLYALYQPGPPPVVAIPGGTGLPADTNGDGWCEDVNGNGRKDFADVVLFFNQMSWIAANEPLSAFDYNANGRIDFADVVWLFNHL